MLSSFLYHAIKAGLDMAIVNAGQLEVYVEIGSEFRGLVEDVMLHMRQDATEMFVDEEKKVEDQGKDKSSQQKDAWREETVEERIKHGKVKGIVDDREADVEVARQKYPRPSELIEGPTIEGMNI